MELGMIGLGRMGTNMVRRLTKAGYHCVVHDVQREAIQTIAKEGAVGTASLKDFVSKLKEPRTVWMMVPRQWSNQRCKPSSRFWNART
jgi:6-phosphogluconate dehydrogenase